MENKDIIIVDKDDRPIGVKPRKYVDPSKDIYRITGIWVTNKNNEVLIAQRKFSKKTDPDKWGPAVAGTLEEGETYESNAYKELEEEIGVVGIKLSVGPKLFVDTPRKHFIQWYTCTIDKPAGEFTLQEEEVEQVRWVSVDVLKSMVEENPADYVPSMSKIVQMFSA